MKKLLAVSILAVMLFCFTACNYQMFDCNYKFDKALVKIGEEWVEVDVKKWADYEGEQLQLTLTDGTVLVVNSVNCILYNGKLPN